MHVLVFFLQERRHQDTSSRWDTRIHAERIRVLSARPKTLWLRNIIITGLTHWIEPWSFYKRGKCKSDSGKSQPKWKVKYTIMWNMESPWLKVGPKIGLNSHCSGTSLLCLPIIGLLNRVNTSIDMFLHVENYGFKTCFETMCMEPWNKAGCRMLKKTSINYVFLACFLLLLYIH